jgi:hypothetical protein
MLQGLGLNHRISEQDKKNGQNMFKHKFEYKIVSLLRTKNECLKLVFFPQYPINRSIIDAKPEKTGAEETFIRTISILG